MDENISRNIAQLCGVIAAAPVFSHSGRGESFYTFPLEVARLSGATFNQQVASIDSVFTFPYLGSGTAETYLAATCEIDGICMNARDDIIAQLKEGLYIKKL